jgi:6-phosphogluconolactonase
MTRWDSMRYVLTGCVVGALLAGCGGSQPPGSLPPSGSNAQTSASKSGGRPVTTHHYVYVTNSGSRSVSAFAVNASSGALTQLKSSPFSTARTPFGVAIDPTGTFMYVANARFGQVSAYVIHPKSGRLTYVRGQPFKAGEYPKAVAIDPIGKFVYVTNGDSENVSAYAINASGALTQVPGSPFAAGPDPTAEAIDPTGSFLYVVNGGNSSVKGSVSAYTINASNGALTQVPGSPFAAGTLPRGVAIDPTGPFVYVANALSNDVSAFVINASSGALTQLNGSPFTTAFEPTAVAIDPTGTFAYVPTVGYGSGGFVSAFAINASNGALTQVKGSPFRGGYKPTAMAIDPTGRFAYIADNGFGSSGNVSAFAINASSGALTPVPGSPFLAGRHPFGVAIR